MVLKDPFQGGVAEPGTEVVGTNAGITTVTTSVNPYKIGSGGFNIADLTTPKGSVENVYIKTPTTNEFISFGGGSNQPDLSGTPITFQQGLPPGYGSGGSSSGGSGSGGSLGLLLVAALVGVALLAH